METFETIDMRDLDRNIFRLIGDEWMLVTAKKGDRFNTMTASWGGMGSQWNCEVAYVYIRPQRYTYEFVEANDWFTLTFCPERYRRALTLLGTKSGRDGDKVGEAGLTPVAGEHDTVYFQEGEIVLTCRKLYETMLTQDGFRDADTRALYADGAFHKLYIAKIETCRVKR